MRILRWIRELPATLMALPLVSGFLPLVAVRSGVRPKARVRIRGSTTVLIPDRPTAMVLANIWVRKVYPRPDVSDIVLDLGANIGLFSLYVLQSGIKRIYSVEPCPESVTYLRAHLDGHPRGARATVYHAAIGTVSGIAYIPARNSVGNKIQNMPSVETEPVDVLDASVFFDSLDPSPTYVKLDIESNEAPVLRRLLESASSKAIRRVVIEAKPEILELVEVLEASGFMTHVRVMPEKILVGTRQPSSRP